MMSKWVAVSAAAVAVLTAGLYFLFRGAPSGDEAPPAPVTASVPAQPAISNPVPASTATVTLPALDASDELVLSEAALLMGPPFLQTFVKREKVIRHLVATIDALPRKKVAGAVDPLQPIAGQVGSPNSVAVTLGPQDYARYDAFVAGVVAADTPRWVATYFKLYPLFQEAYQSLGYPDGYFNDRLVAVLTHLIDTPYASQPVELINGPGIYQYADSSLESLSAGQKALIRVGPEHGARLRAKLKEIRALVASPPPRTDLGSGR